MEESDVLQVATFRWWVCRRSLHPFFALVAAICLLAVVGWIGRISGLVHWCTVITGTIVSVERTWSFWSRKHEWRWLNLRLVLAVLVLFMSVGLLFHPFGERSLGAHLLVLIAVFVSGLSLVISHQTRFTARAFHPGLVLIMSFICIILGGVLLLKMPLCTVPGQTCSWLDALFTSTSAV